jgi:hypothetical protein
MNEEVKKEEEKETYDPAQQRKNEQEVQKHFNKFKKKFKVKSKSELVAIIWNQGVQYKELQEIAQELYEELKLLKNEQNKNQESSNVKKSK